MRQAPIAEFLDYIGREPGEAATLRKPFSPLRPRSLASAENAESRRGSLFDVALAGPPKLQGEDRAINSPWLRKLTPMAPGAKDGLAAPEARGVEDMTAQLAEAHARGRQEGLAQARAEAERQQAQDRAAAREQAMLERVEFELGESARFEAEIRAGFARLEEDIGAAVARILAPFLVERATTRAVDELRKCIARLCAGGCPRMIVIRGPERLLGLLRERVGDLPVDIRYVEDGGVEAIIEADATEIATQLQAWTELLATLDF